MILALIDPLCYMLVLPHVAKAKAMVGNMQGLSLQWERKQNFYLAKFVFCKYIQLVIPQFMKSSNNN